MRKKTHDKWWQQLNTAEDACVLIAVPSYAGFSFESEKEKTHAVRYNLNKFKQELTTEQRRSLTNCLKNIERKDRYDEN